MSFFGDLGGGLGFIGGIVPGLQGAAVAGGLLTKLGGSPEQLALNPYANGLFGPHQALWGVEQNPVELAGTSWLGGKSASEARALDPNEDALELVVLRAEAKRRGAPERLNRKRVLAKPAQLGGEWKTYWVWSVSSEPKLGAVLRVDVYNKLIDTLQARIDAHGDADPVFPYIDRRKWAEWGQDAWHDQVGLYNGKPVTSLADWLARKTAQAQKAYDQWSTFNAGEEARYEAEAQAWRAWRASIAREEDRQDQVAAVTEQINAIYQAEPDTAVAAQKVAALTAAVAQGTVVLSKLDKPSVNVQSASASEPMSGTSVAIAAGLVALLLVLSLEG